MVGVANFPPGKEKKKRNMTDKLKHCTGWSVHACLGPCWNKAPVSDVSNRQGEARLTSKLISRDSALCPTAVQKQEVTTTTSLIKTQGVLSMDAPTQAPSVKTRLGNKVQTAPASSTTSGFGPSTKTSAGRNWQSVSDMTGYLKQLIIIIHKFSIALFPAERAQHACSHTCT